MTMAKSDNHHNKMKWRRSSRHDKSWPNNCDSKSKSLFYQIQTTKQHVVHKQQHVHPDCMNAVAHTVRFPSALKMALTDGDKLHGKKTDVHYEKKCTSQTWSWTCSAIFFEVLTNCLDFIMFSTNVQIKKQVISWLFQSPNREREKQRRNSLMQKLMFDVIISCATVSHINFFFFFCKLE